ncbi:Nmgp-1p [Parelaphostrongylus tenuis]|uniref:Nmgp-1p n=1 Tax=Parelaphostrongylus tenuis TaxID=148309 RepID=A0AAD5QRX4_PARTN|nr:Nmgp-1p [Parelaphostrongylus tenuis]
MSTPCLSVPLWQRSKIRGDGVYGVVPGDVHRRVVNSPPEITTNGRIPVVYHAKDGCFNRLPYASLMATFLCFIGVVLFSIMMTWGFNATVEQTRRSLRIQDWPWLDKVQVFFVAIAVLMSIFALLFLLVGFSATGATREEMYKRSDKKARFGGQCACATAMAWCVIMIVSWLFIISLCSILCCAYSIFDDLCYAMTSFTEVDCINFGVFIPLVKSFSSSDLRLCGGDAQQFCALSSTASSWYIVGWVGSCLVILGLAFFLAILASNYTHVGNVTRYVELRDLALEVSSNDSASHLKHDEDDAVYHPRRVGAKVKNESVVNGSTIDWQARRGDTSSCSRFAEQISNSSLSFYNYRGH